VQFTVICWQSVVQVYPDIRHGVSSEK
jgi:hypothetical protein